jgi:hypothetical protein
VNQTTRDPTDLLQHDLDDAAQAERLESLRKQDTEDLKWLMAHKQGRRIVWSLLSSAGVTRTPWNHSGSVTAFNCGKQQIGLELLARIMEHVPEAYVVMLKEHK